MATLEYVQLVVLTECPGARIGRTPDATLSPEERTVGAALELIRQLQAAHQVDCSDPLLVLLRGLSADDWRAAMTTLHLLDHGWLSSRIRRVIRLAGLRATDDAGMRTERLGALPERIKALIGRVAWPLIFADLHPPLMRFILQHADAIAGAHELPGAVP